MARVFQELEQALPTLGKAVYSQPADRLSASKVTVRPLAIKGQLRYQIETFRDNKAFHKNVDGPELLLIAQNELEGRYRQVLLVSDKESAQYVLRQRGDYKKAPAVQVCPVPAERKVITARRNIYSGKERTYRLLLTWVSLPGTLKLSVRGMINTSR